MTIISRDYMRVGLSVGSSISQSVRPKRKFLVSQKRQKLKSVMTRRGEIRQVTTYFVHTQKPIDMVTKRDLCVAKRHLKTLVCKRKPCKKGHVKLHLKLVSR